MGQMAKEKNLMMQFETILKKSETSGFVWFLKLALNADFQK